MIKQIHYICLYLFNNYYLYWWNNTFFYWYFECIDIHEFQISKLFDVVLYWCVSTLSTYSEWIINIYPYSILTTHPSPRVRLYVRKFTAILNFLSSAHSRVGLLLIAHNEHNFGCIWHPYKPTHTHASCTSASKCVRKVESRSSAIHSSEIAHQNNTVLDHTRLVHHRISVPRSLKFFIGKYLHSLDQ